MKHIALIALAAFLFACGGPKEDPPKPAIAVDVTPKAVALSPLAAQAFTAMVTGTADLSVIWTADGGTVNSSGHYTAPAAWGTYHVTATSSADSTAKGTATVTVNPPPIVVSITPVDPLNGCGTVQLAALVTGGSGANAGVTWSIADAPLPDSHSLGTVSPTGLYTAPDPRPYSQMIVHVRATSVEDPNASAVIPITTNFKITQVTVAPATVSLAVGGTQQFTATVTTSCGL
jgi:hypothetical protein